MASWRSIGTAAADQHGSNDGTGVLRRHGGVVERVIHRSVTDEYESEGNGRAVSLSLSYAYEAWSVRKTERKTGRALETMPILGKLKFAQTIPIYGWKE